MFDVKALMTQDGYRRYLRSPVRGLWTGALSYDQFFSIFMETIRAGFTAAWQSGAGECGIAPDEYTPQEKQALESAISQEFGFIEGFATAIEENSKANKGKLGPLFLRLDLWVKRYLDIQNRAKSLACENQKLKWVIDPAKESCCSCLRLRNRVKRASFWREKDIRPQHQSLHCMQSAGGPSVCGCKFEQTDEPLSKGPLPNWRC